ncbi:hypothetical protein PLICRDRAFT_526603 [Plicaturopsis crispa FD-325 SS-3]|nr:hypothetical protein PLICRDRAFT_526603 [Plicaturopsis crispa FD-325 SS-3]
MSVAGDFVCADSDESSRAATAFERMARLLDALRPAVPPALRLYMWNTVQDTYGSAKPYHALVCAKTPLVDGLQGLKKLLVHWEVHDADPSAQYAHTHLLALVRPSLCTLVHLELKIDQSRQRFRPFDLTALRDAGSTLRVFRYWAHIRDRGALEQITKLFPFLEWLCLEFKSHHDLLPGRLADSCPVWKTKHVALLARLPHLVYFSSMHDMEHNDADVYDNRYDNCAYPECGDFNRDETE